MHATFNVTHSSRDGIKLNMRHNFFKKKSTQPVGAWSAGCVFKNPEEKAAGMLLEQAGFKGFAHGGMRFSSLHANFLVNEGNGSATAALEIIEKARQAVLQLFGIELELEVKVLPCQAR